MGIDFLTLSKARRLVEEKIKEAGGMTSEGIAEKVTEVINEGNIIDSRVNELLSENGVDDLKDFIGYEKTEIPIDIQWANGSFACSGTTFTKGSSNAMCVSNKIVLEKDTVIKVDVANGYSARIDCFATLDIENGTCSSTRANSGWIAENFEYKVKEGITTLLFRGAKEDRTTNVSASEIKENIKFYVLTGAKTALTRIENLESISNPIFSSVGIFNSIGAMGDSYTQGSAYVNGTWVQLSDKAYVGTMAKRSGIKYHNYGLGGSSTRSYITDKLPNVLGQTEKDDLYFMCWGINDLEKLGTTYLGTINDIKSDYTQNADTFYGNYGKIISQMMSYAPNAKFVLLGVYKPDGTSESKKYSTFSNAVKEIANHFNIPYINPFDDAYFSSDIYKNSMVEGHPTAMGYVGSGIAFERLFSKCVENNFTYFM